MDRLFEIFRSALPAIAQSMFTMLLFSLVMLYAYMGCKVWAWTPIYAALFLSPYCFVICFVLLALGFVMIAITFDTIRNILENSSQEKS